VAAVEIAGIKKLKIYNTGNIKNGNINFKYIDNCLFVSSVVFKHPNYYKNLRKLARLRNRDQAISLQLATAAEERTPGTGQQADEELTALQTYVKNTKKPI